MTFLKWISDDDLKNEVSQLLSVAKEAQKTAVNKFGKNVIDPFAAIFEIAGFEIDHPKVKASLQFPLKSNLPTFHTINFTFVLIKNIFIK